MQALKYNYNINYNCACTCTTYNILQTCLHFCNIIHYRCVYWVTDASSEWLWPTEYLKIQSSTSCWKCGSTCGGKFRILCSRFLQKAAMASLVFSCDANFSRVLPMVRIKYVDSSLEDSSCIFLRFPGGFGVFGFFLVAVDSAVDSGKGVLGRSSASMKLGSSWVPGQVSLMVPSECGQESLSAEGSLKKIKR